MILRFIFEHFYIILGLFAVWFVVGMYRWDSKRSKLTGQPRFSSFYHTPPHGSSLWVVVGASFRNAAVAFFIGMMMGTIPFSFLVAPLIQYYHTPQLLINIIVASAWAVLMITLQIIWGYFSLKNMGRRAWLYGVGVFVALTLGFGIIFAVTPCRNSCMRNKDNVLLAMWNNPLQTYGYLMIFGGILGVGPLIGGVIASFRKPYPHHKI